MKGFFNKEDKESDCIKCKLYKGCRTPKMKESGKGEKGILIIAEAPGRTEDEKGTQLVGEAGQVLRDTLNEFDIDLDRDCWKTNATACRPPNNRTPTKREIKCCNPRMIKTIKEKSPRLIILLGGTSLDSFLTQRLKGASGGINKWRGFVIPDQIQKAWIAPAFHPSFVLRSRGIKAVGRLFEKDIENALSKLNKEVPVYNYKIDILDEFRANNMLQGLLDYPPELLGFDYETTGLSSYREGHKIVCCSVCHDGETAYIFEFTDKLIKWWKQILNSRKIKKTAHNIKFEHQWSRNILGVETRRWEWDSMLASHILDNRKGITGLKFQAYVNFGREDYSSHLDKYIKYNDGNNFNRIKDADIREVMRYCGMDNLIQYRLAIKQMRLLR
jgi:DNA polymerase